MSEIDKEYKKEREIDEEIDEKKEPKGMKEEKDKQIEDKKDQEKDELEKKVPNPNLTAINSICNNIRSWVTLLIFIYIISYPNFISGYITFFIFILLVYFVHKGSHYKRNILTIIHHYHHENNNIFSHISQIILEICLGGVFFPFCINTNPFLYVINGWVIVFFTLFYTTIHNINYGLFKVNDVHSSHHKNISTNIGPDICDVFFSTKSDKDIEVENTDHYIPNTIICAIIVLMIKRLCLDDGVRNILSSLTYTVLIASYIFLAVSSLYLIMYYEKK